MRRSTITLMALMLVFAACGDDEGSVTTEAVAATTTAPAPTTTAPAPTTTVPPTTTTEQPTTTTTAALPESFGETEITISIELYMSSDVAAGRVTATGPAVDAGLLCPGGTNFEAAHDEASGSETWETRFVCADKSGSFQVAVADHGERADGAWVHSGTWVWMTDKGSDAMIGITGDGVEEGVCDLDTTVCVETYTGTIQRDA